MKHEWKYTLQYQNVYGSKLMCFGIDIPQEQTMGLQLVDSRKIP